MLREEGYGAVFETRSDRVQPDAALAQREASIHARDPETGGIDP